MSCTNEDSCVSLIVLLKMQAEFSGLQQPVSFRIADDDKLEALSVMFNQFALLIGPTRVQIHSPESIICYIVQLSLFAFN